MRQEPAHKEGGNGGVKIRKRNKTGAMHSEGFILLSRKIERWAWADDPLVGWTFVRLLLMAKWRRTEWRGLVLERGQCVVSVLGMAERFGVGRQKMRSTIKILEANQQITIKTTNRYTIVTICNYDKYQFSPDGKQPIEKPTNNHQITNKQPSNNQQTGQVEGNKINKLINNPPLRGGAGARGREGGWDAAVEMRLPANPTRRDYARALAEDHAWLEKCRQDRNLEKKMLLMYVVAFNEYLIQKKPGRSWNNYEDFRMNFYNWLRFMGNDDEVKTLVKSAKTRKWKADNRRIYEEIKAKEHAEMEERIRQREQITNNK